MPEITLYLLSGFLGAGKTTLLRRMLEHYAQLRVGVLVNEFGQLGIDGRLIESGEIQMTEIDNGSIFCSCPQSAVCRRADTVFAEPGRSSSGGELRLGGPDGYGENTRGYQEQTGTPI